MKVLLDRGVGINSLQSIMQLDPNKPMPGIAGYGLIDVMAALFVVGTMAVSLYAGFSSGFSVVRLARENLRATQIMLQRLEDCRLYNWNQLTNSTVVAPAFTDYFDPSGINSGSVGATYHGTISNTVPTNLPVAYRNNTRVLTVTLVWTNSLGSTNAIVHSRQMQTLVARYGMQNFVSR